MLKGSPGLQSYRGFGVPSIGRYVPNGTFYRGYNGSDYSNKMLRERGDPLSQFIGINPKSIAGEKTSKEKALKLILGSSSSLTNISAGAKNNIVGFNRAKVSPKTNNLGSLISTISTSIFNTTNTISNIFGDKNNKKPEKNFGFFSKIKDVIGFINFFGKKKNLDKIKESLENLKSTFSETFDVAKALRKAILKIVDQLTGFSAGGGSGLLGAIMSAVSGLIGGLLGGLIPGRRRDNVPRQRTRQNNRLMPQGPRGLKGALGKLLLGGGLLGTGAAVSGLMQPGGEEVQPGETSPEIPGNILDRFNSILDRFDKAIESLLKTGPKPNKGNPSQEPSSDQTPTENPPGPPSPPGSPGVKIKDEEQALKELGISQSQWDAYKQGIADVEGARYNQMGGAGGRYAGRYQMGPDEIASSAKAMGMSVPTQKEFLSNPELQEKLYLSYTLLNKRYMMNLSTKFKGMKPEEQIKYLPGAQLGVGTLTDFIESGKAGTDSAGVSLMKWINAVQRRMQNISPRTSLQSVIPQNPGTENQIATIKNQPQPSSKPKLNLISLGGPEPASPPSRVASIPTPPVGGNGPTIPFLLSLNPDNIERLGSNITYNIA